MNIFEIFVFVFLLLSLFVKNNKREAMIFYIISLIALIYIAAMKDLEVGTDTIHYYTGFIYGSDEHESRGELVYSFFRNIFHRFGNYDSFMVFIYFIIVGGIGFVVSRLSNNRFLSLFLYVALAYYTPSFNIMRQYLAVSFMFFGMYFVSRHRDKNGILIFLGSLVLSIYTHRSSLVSLLFLPFFYYRIKDLLWYIGIGTSFLIGIIFSSYLSIIFDPFYDLLGDYYYGYLDRAELSASRSLISNGGLNLIGAATLFFAPRNSDKHWTVQFFVFSVILNNIFGWSYLSRVSTYYGIAQILAIPLVYYSIKKKVVKWSYWSFVIVYSLAKFYMVTLHNDGILPYMTR